MQQFEANRTILTGVMAKKIIYIFLNFDLLLPHVTFDRDIKKNYGFTFIFDVDKICGRGW